MIHIPIRFSTLLLVFSVLLFTSAPSLAVTRGIYINQSTIENTATMKRLIRESKATGINTFVIDLISREGNRYAQNVKMVQDAGLRYVVRIVVFPLGGTPDQVKSRSYWEQKYTKVARALALGADEVQLDYIRYNTKQRPIAQNTRDVLEVIKFFKTRVEKHGKKLQLAVFGETSFKESPRIGQNIKTFTGHFDVLCPMLYPSHYEPYKKHAVQPYETVFSSLQAIKKQFNNNVPFKVRAYIELSNYRYKMSESTRLGYIDAQIKATRDAQIDGWYAWSANNHYDILFNYLKGTQKQKLQARQ